MTGDAYIEQLAWAQMDRYGRAHP